MEHAEGSIVIDAPLEDVMEVIEDYESYPEWADVRSVDVRQRGEGGRATEVAFEVDVPVLGQGVVHARLPLRARRHRPVLGDDGGARGDPRHPRRVPAARGRRRHHEGDLPARRSSSACSCRGSFAREGAKRVIENALEQLKRRVEMG